MNKNNNNVYFNYPTDYLSCDLVRSKFLDKSLFRRIVEKTVCNDYQIWKSTSRIVKDLPIPLFRPTQLEMKEPLWLKSKSRKPEKTTNYKYFKKYTKM